MAQAIGSGVRIFGDYDTLLNDPAIDAIYLPLPNGLHYEWALRALQMGKHVLAEKPLASNAEEARRLVSLAAERRLVLMEAMHSFHHPFHARARALLRSGLIGDVTHVKASFSIREGAFDRQASTRYSRALAGGSTLDLGGYTLGVMASLMDGEVPELVSATASRWSADETIDEAMRGKLRFRDGGVRGSFSWSFTARRDERRFVVNGTAGKLVGTEFVHPHFGATLHATAHDTPANARRAPKLMRREGFGRPSTYALQLRAFATAVRQMQADEEAQVSRESQPPSTGETVVGLAELLDEVYRRAGMSPRVGPSGIAAAAADSMASRGTSARLKLIPTLDEASAAAAAEPVGSPDQGGARSLTPQLLAEMQASSQAAALKIDPPECSSCEQLEPLWLMLAEHHPDSTYSAPCADVPELCGAWDVAGAGGIGASSPLLLLWDGGAFARYVGPPRAEDLLEWTLAGLRGQPIDPTKTARLAGAAPRPTPPSMHRLADAAAAGGDPFGEGGSFRGEGCGEARRETTIRLSWRPSIVLLPGFVDNATCDALIARGEPLLSRNEDAAAGGSALRTSEGGWFSRTDERDEPLRSLMARVHHQFGVPPDHGSNFVRARSPARYPPPVFSPLSFTPPLPLPPPPTRRTRTCPPLGRSWRGTVRARSTSCTTIRPEANSCAPTPSLHTSTRPLVVVKPSFRASHLFPTSHRPDETPHEAPAVARA